MSESITPLSRIKVIEVGSAIAGPQCATLLADWGAEVIKVEPLQGDRYRTSGTVAVKGENTSFLCVNRTKRSIAVDMKSDEGREILLGLARTADVLIQNLSLGATDRLGLGYEDLKKVNPRLVYCSVSGFGSKRPHSKRKAFDLVAQAMGGMMDMTGESEGAPMPAGAPIADFTTAMTTTIGVLLALSQRARSGVGSLVESSLQDSIMYMLGPRILEYIHGNQEAVRRGSGHPQNCPHQAFEARDGWFVVTVTDNASFRRFCDSMDLPQLCQDSRFENSLGRIRNEKPLVGLLEPIFRKLSREDLLQRFASHGVPAGPVRSVKELVAEEMEHQTGLFPEIEHYQGGQFTTIAGPFTIDGKRAAVWQSAPRAGQHTRQVLAELGFTQDDINGYLRKGVVKT